MFEQNLYVYYGIILGSIIYFLITKKILVIEYNDDHKSCCSSRYNKSCCMSSVTCDN